MSLPLAEVARLLEATVLSGEGLEERKVTVVCGSDLMSDVLSFGRRAQLLLTGLTNPQTVRTAELSDIAAICFVHGKRPAPDAIRLAQSTGIVLLATDASMFSACAALAGAGLVGCDA